MFLPPFGLFLPGGARRIKLRHRRIYSHQHEPQGCAAPAADGLDAVLPFTLCLTNCLISYQDYHMLLLTLADLPEGDPRRLASNKKIGAMCLFGNALAWAQYKDLGIKSRGTRLGIRKRWKRGPYAYPTS